jgi:hypothetical protein
MKTQLQTIISGLHNVELEAYITKKDAELKELMRSNAKHLAKTSRPIANGDKLSFYTGEVKSGYEQLSAYTNKFLQPDSQATQAKIEDDHFKQKAKSLSEAISHKENKINNAESQQEKHNSASISLRFWAVVIITFIISSGEAFFTTDSLQTLGGSLLFSLFISISISLAIMAASHMIPYIYKIQPTTLRRRIVLLISLVLVIGVFSGLAHLRSEYLAKQDIVANPLIFVLLNLFLFSVSTVLSYAYMPTWEEIKEHFRHVKLSRAIHKHKKENRSMKEEIEAITASVMEKTQDRINLGYYSMHSTKRIKALYKESVEVFKSTNLAYRTDGKTPDCFNDPIPELDIEEFTFSFTPNNNQQ